MTEIRETTTSVESWGVIRWKGCQLWESTDSFLHGVQMPVVTDDPAEAHGADVVGGEGGGGRGGRGRLYQQHERKHWKECQTNIRCSVQVCCSEEKMSWWEAEPKTLLRSCFIFPVLTVRTPRMLCLDLENVKQQCTDQVLVFSFPSSSLSLISFLFPPHFLQSRRSDIVNR